MRKLLAIAVLLPGCFLSSGPTRPITPMQDFDRLMKELSNWGRWGKDDQMGAVNLITPAKRKSALGLVKDGISVSMARRAEIEAAVDNPRPITRTMGGGGRGRGGNSDAPPP